MHQPITFHWNQWKNSLAPKHGLGKALQISKNGSSSYVIVTPKTPTSIETNAASLLSEYLKRITGALVIIRTDEHPPHPYEFCIGETNRHSTTETYGEDGYSIQQAHQSIYFHGGRGRGLINGIIAFLEEDLGCRWYTDGPCVIPHQSTLSLCVSSRTYTPKLKVRDPYYYVSFNGAWSLYNRTNAPDAPVPIELGGYHSYPTIGTNTDHIHKNLFVHTYHTLIDPELPEHDHPEYWMLNADGERVKHQLCETHPKVLQLVTENARSYLRAHPKASMISISKMDGGGTCLCHTCQQLNDRELSDSASLLHLVNHVAKHLEAEFPHVTFTTLAYLETISPPKFTSPHKNVAIWICNDLCSWPTPFKPVKDHPQLCDIIQDWSKICQRLYIWDYNVNFSHYCAPMPNMEVIAKNIRFWIDQGAEGVMTQGAFQCSGTERDWMRSWVISKLLWNPHADLQELMQDFIWGYYQEAAPYMLEYNELLERQYHKYGERMNTPQGIRFNMKSDFLTDGFIDKADALFEKALAAANNTQMVHRIERDYLSILYVKIQQWTGPSSEFYQSMIDQFETIARRESMTHTGETTDGPNLDRALTIWRDGMSDGLIKFSPNHTTFKDVIHLEVSTHMGAIYLTYTLDGSEPTAASPRVPESHIIIQESCTLKIGMFMLGSCVGNTISSRDYQKI